MRLSPVLGGMGAYPFLRLSEARRAAEAAGVDVIDFGMGEPREETPAFIRRALVDALELEPVSAYPRAEGLPETRAAIADWTRRRFGASLDPDTEVVPTLGSKEALFGLAQVVGGPGATVGVPSPGYPVPERGALFAGARTVDVPLSGRRGWLPDLDALPDELDRLGQRPADERRGLLARLAHPEVDDVDAPGLRRRAGLRQAHERVRAETGEDGAQAHAKRSRVS